MLQGQSTDLELCDIALGKNPEFNHKVIQESSDQQHMQDQLITKHAVLLH